MKPWWDYYAWTLAIQVPVLSHIPPVPLFPCLSQPGQKDPLWRRRQIWESQDNRNFMMFSRCWDGILTGPYRPLQDFPATKAESETAKSAFNLKPKPWFKADLNSHLDDIFWIDMLKNPRAGFALFKGDVLLFEGWRRELSFYYYSNLHSYSIFYPPNPKVLYKWYERVS